MSYVRLYQSCFTTLYMPTMTKKQKEHTSIILNDDAFVIMRDNVTSERYKMHASWEIISAITYYCFIIDCVRKKLDNGMFIPRQKAITFATK